MLSSPMNDNSVLHCPHLEHESIVYATTTYTSMDSYRKKTLEIQNLLIWLIVNNYLVIWWYSNIF